MDGQTSSTTGIRDHPVKDQQPVRPDPTQGPLRLSKPKKRVSGIRRREATWGIILAMPYLVGFVVWIAAPVIASLVFSFFQYDIVSMTWIGLQNYVRAFTGDRLFYTAYSRTIYYAALSVPLGILTSLGLAWMLNQKMRGTHIFRSLFYAPSLTPVTALALLWGWIFNAQFGVMNYVYNAITGLQGPNWGAPEWAMPVVIIAGTWAAAGGSSMLIFLAALQGVPTEIYEAAEIDGAGAWRKFISVTLPFISPTIFFLTVLGIIAAVKSFDLIFNLANNVGGPAYSRYVMALHIYNSAFRYNEMGYASALSWIFMLVILGLTLVQFAFQRRWVFYAGEAVS
jgi:multiple sugar transport system permease protein